MRASGSALRIAPAFIVLFGAAVHAQSLPVLPLRAGEAAFHVRVTVVRDFTGHAPVALAEYTGTDLASVRGFVVVRVAEMRTGIGLRDRHLRGALHADSFPEIRFDLARAEPGVARGDTLAAEFVGRLTIHGVTREVRAAGTVVQTRDGIDVLATFPLDMRDYGVTPPVRMLGTLRVAPDVQVSVHLAFGAAPAVRDH